MCLPSKNPKNIVDPVAAQAFVVAWSEFVHSLNVSTDCTATTTPVIHMQGSCSWNVQHGRTLIPCNFCKWLLERLPDPELEECPGHTEDEFTDPIRSQILQGSKKKTNIKDMIAEYCFQVGSLG